MPIFISAIAMEKGSELMAVSAIGCQKIYTTLHNGVFKYISHQSWPHLAGGRIPQTIYLKLSYTYNLSGRSVCLKTVLKRAEEVSK